MNALDFLDLVIGLIFIYLIFSIACSTLWELIVNLSSLRGRMLRNWFFKVFDHKIGDKKLGEKIFNHPLIKGLSNKEKNLPSYIPSELFSEAFLDVIANDSDEDATINALDINKLKEKLESTTLIPIGLKRIFLQYVNDAVGNLDAVKTKLGNWYNSAQDRLIGAYKKKLHLSILIISIVLVGATNTDTLTLANYLYHNDDARISLANQASEFMQDSLLALKIEDIKTTIVNVQANDSIKQDTLSQKEIMKSLDENFKDLKSLKAELNEAKIPIGWSIEKDIEYGFWDVIKKIFGLLLTALAVSLGSPFWFDILNKLANLRSSGKRPKTP